MGNQSKWRGAMERGVGGGILWLQWHGMAIVKKEEERRRRIKKRFHINTRLYKAAEFRRCRKGLLLKTCYTIVVDTSCGGDGGGGDDDGTYKQWHMCIISIIISI